MTSGSPQITTPFFDDRRATVALEVTVENTSNRATEVFVETVMLDADGKEVARSESGVTMAANQQGSTKQWINFRRPVLWSADAPYLYTAKTMLWLGEEMVSTSESTFGVKRPDSADE